MAYKIVSQAKAWRPVFFNGLTEEGEVVENFFEVRFIILDEDENADLENDIREAITAAGSDDRRLSEISTPIVLRFVEDWRGALEDDGTEQGRSMPFDAANLARMIRVPNVLKGITSAYRDARAGEPARRAGN